MNTLQEMLNKPFFKSQKQALEVVAEKTEMYYSQRIEEVFNEAEWRYNNDATALDWAEGEKERFLSDQAYDLALIAQAMEKLNKRQAVYPDDLAFRSIYRVNWDGINLGWRVA